MLAYPIGRFAERAYCCGFTKSIVLLGSFYLAFMVYAFFFTLFIDIVRLGDHFVGFLPEVIQQNSQKAAYVAFLIIFILTSVIVSIGHYNALHPRIRKIDLKINKSANELKKLKIVFASDIHLGTIIRNSRLLKIVDKINSLNPDLVLFPGDVVDEDIAPLSEQNMAQSFFKIKSKLGVYAITGNHEYFGGVNRSVAYIEEGNIVVLQDSVAKISDSFYLVGRKDLTGNRMGDKRRSLDDMVKNLDKNLPIILMDHQPFHLEQAELNNIDLQISGHTHHGQMFPFNLITKKIFELSWGYLKKGNTHYYVSCGVGTWGPPIRIGNRPEIVQINLRFN
jgi:predicted MPP superfamily phosphohydrolase